MFSKLLLFSLGCAVSVCGFTADAFATGSENVLVVVNANSPESVALANEYIHLRKIPASNIVYLKKVPFLKDSSEGGYTKLCKPQVFDKVRQTIRDRKLDRQIDCIVYSAGFPTRISFQPQMREYLKRRGEKYNIHKHAPWGSITSLTYLHEEVFGNGKNYLEPDANWYATSQVHDLLENPFTGEAKERFRFARSAQNSGQYDAAIDGFSKLVDQHPRQVVVRYLLAQCLAKNDEPQRAVRQLTQCVQDGWCYRSFTKADRSFSELADVKAFVELVATMKDAPKGRIPGRPFSASQSWSRNGWPNSTAREGRRYMLSTMLAVVRPDGSSLDQAIDQIKRSVSADGTRPAGRFFFAKHKDVRSRVRQREFSQTANELKRLGFQVEISSKKWPQAGDPVLGANLGSAVVDWSQAKCQFAPGAICDNLTSYGGWWEKAGQTQLTDHLNAGAAGASGTVYEPYAVAHKFPTARLHEHYANGFTLAESFYQTIRCPFQLLVVGDPLCCPFGTFPKFKLTAKTIAPVAKGMFTFNISPESDSPGIRRYEFFLDDIYVQSLRKQGNIDLDTSSLDDGYHEIRVAAVSDTTAENQCTEILGFVVAQKKTLPLRIWCDQPNVELGSNVIIEAEAGSFDSIQILQNSRPVGRITPRKPTVTIDSRLLGEGPTKLQGFAQSNGMTIASEPITIVVSRQRR